MDRGRRTILRVSAHAACVLAALPLAATATSRCGEPDAWPLPFRLTFEATAARSVLWVTGHSDLVLTREGNAYQLVSETSAAGVYHARQTSRGLVAADGLVPIEYTEQRGRRPQESTRFDWRARRVSFSAAAEPAETRAHMQDRLSMLLELGRLLQQRPGAAFVELPVAGVRNTRLYRFERRGTEALDLPAGRFDAVKLERETDATGNERHDRLEIWLAPALCWLPVRLRYADDRGMTIDQQLKAAQLAP